jgi:hypothetical protein
MSYRGRRVEKTDNEGRGRGKGFAVILGNIGERNKNKLGRTMRRENPGELVRYESNEIKHGW